MIKTNQKLYIATIDNYLKKIEVHEYEITHMAEDYINYIFGDLAHICKSNVLTKYLDTVRFNGMDSVVFSLDKKLALWLLTNSITKEANILNEQANQYYELVRNVYDAYDNEGE